MNLFVHASDRQNKNEPVYQFTIQNHVSLPSAKVRIILKQATLTNNVPLFETGQNTLSVVYGGAFYEVVVPSSFTYTGTTLATALQTALNAQVAAVFTVTYSSSANTFTITSSGSTFYFSTKNPIQISTILGLPLASQAKLSWTTLPLRLDGSAFVDIALQNVVSTTQIITSAYRNSIIGRVQLNASPGNTVFYENNSNSDQGITTEASQLQTIHVALLNEWGNYFQMPDNSVVSFVLQLQVL